MIRHLILLGGAVGLAACGDGSADLDQTGPRPELPEIHERLLPAMNIATPADWNGEAPRVPDGFTITALATDLKIPRQTLVLPNGDILVAEGSGGNAPKVRPKDIVAGMIKARGKTTVEGGDRITLLRDADRDGVAEVRTVFIDNLNAPYGAFRLSMNTVRTSATPSRSASRRSVMRSPPSTVVLPRALIMPATMSLGRTLGALPPDPSATRMSPLGSTRVWRGILRSVASAVIVKPSGTRGASPFQSAGVAMFIAGRSRSWISGNSGRGPVWSRSALPSPQAARPTAPPRRMRCRIIGRPPARA